MATSLMLKWHALENPARIFCLYGDLGSGKTTFTQGFAHGLGITERLLSPTYLIMRRYTIVNNLKELYHLDLYRTNSYHELIAIGIEEVLSDPRSCAIIEWADKLKERVPKNRIDLFFTANADTSHTIEVKEYAP